MPGPHLENRSAMPAPIDAPEGRRLSVPGYLAIVVVYLLLVQVLGLAMSGLTDADYGEFPDVESVLLTLWVPVGASALFIAGIVTWLGWWRPVLRDRDDIPRLPGWVWVVPVLMVLAILAGTNYGGLVDLGPVYITLAVIGALFIGFAEETTFRGVGVTTFRAKGCSEARVALWTCVFFGAAHATNIFSEGGGAFFQVLVTIAAGFFLYLVRRLGRGLLLPVLVHAFWDFGLFSGTLGDDLYAATMAFVLADVVLVIVLLVGHRRLHLDGAEPATPAAT